MTAFELAQQAANEIDRGFARRFLGRFFWRTRIGRVRLLLTKVMTETQPGWSPPPE